MYEFVPKRVLFEQAALEYPLGRELRERFGAMGIPMETIASHNRIKAESGLTPQQAFAEAKRTLVVGVRKSEEFEGCKPSAHYQLPFATSCPGMCEYCYLHTTLGKRPYVRVYVNVDELLERVAGYINGRIPSVTVFEGASTSDPIPVERYTGTLKRTIGFFGGQEYGRFRFVTKFTDVDSLLDAEHNGHTRFRFSVNAATIIRKYEHRTPSMEERVDAAGKVAEAGYPMGFIIAPIFLFDGWREEYTTLMESLRDRLGPAAAGDISFELITHRFTKRAKSNILALFPETDLPMDEAEGRKFKYGQFGYGKYVYTTETMDEMKEFFHNGLNRLFPNAEISYFV